MTFIQTQTQRLLELYNGNTDHTIKHVEEFIRFTTGLNMELHLAVYKKILKTLKNGE